MFKLMLFLSGGLCGWLLKAMLDTKSEDNRKIYIQPEQSAQPMQDLSLTDWDNVAEEQFAMAEAPPEDIPEDIEVPQLPFEESEEEEEDRVIDDDHPNGFHPYYDAEKIEVITEDQYLDEYNAYGKDTLLYFSEIDELTWSDEDRIDDKSMVTGDVQDLFFGNGSTAEVVYVRNNRLAIDFMIERRDGTPYWYESE